MHQHIITLGAKAAFSELSNLIYDFLVFLGWDINYVSSNTSWIFYKADFTETGLMLLLAFLRDLNYPNEPLPIFLVSEEFLRWNV